MNLLHDCPIVEYDEDAVTLDEFTIPLDALDTKEDNSKLYRKTDDNGHILRLNIVNEKFIPPIIFGLKHLQRLYIRKTCFISCKRPRIPRHIKCLANLTGLSFSRTNIA
jgi:hypothetical protein